MNRILIGIEGLVGSGKTTISKMLLNENSESIYFEVGSLYSQIAEIILAHPENITEKFLRSLKITYSINKQRVIEFLINGEKILIIHSKIKNRQVIYHNYELLTKIFSAEIRQIVETERKIHDIIYDGRNQIRILGEENVDIHFVITAKNSLRYERMRVRDNEKSNEVFVKRDKFERRLNSIYDEKTHYINSTNLNKKQLFVETKRIIDRFRAFK